MTRNFMHAGESLAPRVLPDDRGQHLSACTAGRVCT
jgi:hypothetical protein